MSNQRVITVFTSKGKKQKITTDATTWGVLKPLVEEHYDLNNLQATENIGKTTLMHVDAVLPEAAFVLFLRPIKTKSGSDFDTMSFVDLRGALTAQDKLDLEETVGVNWTRVKKQDIINQLNSRADAEVEAEVEARVEKEVVVEAEVEEESEDTFVAPTNLELIKEIENSLEKICANSTEEEICERVSVIQEELLGLKDVVETELYNESKEEEVETEEDRLIREKAEEKAAAEAAEDEALKNQYKDLKGGF